VKKINTEKGRKLNIRIGLHSGPVVAGILGWNRYNFDLWGETVNVAQLMEQTGTFFHLLFLPSFLILFV
jgi:class 3 adenylate cyclase